MGGAKPRAQRVNPSLSASLRWGLHQRFPCDPETGRAYPQPRVWRHEVEWQAVWIIELPA